MSVIFFTDKYTKDWYEKTFEKYLIHYKEQIRINADKYSSYQCIKADCLKFFIKALDADLKAGNKIDFSFFGCKSCDEFIDYSLPFSIHRTVIAYWGTDGPFKAVYDKVQDHTTRTCVIF